MAKSKRDKQPPRRGLRCLVGIHRDGWVERVEMSAGTLFLCQCIRCDRPRCTYAGARLKNPPAPGSPESAQNKSRWEYAKAWFEQRAMRGETFATWWC